MSWQAYVDDHLMGEIDENHLTSAAIVGLDGSVWAQSPNFPQFWILQFKWAIHIGLPLRIGTSNSMKKGANLLKYGTRRKPKFCPFRLSNKIHTVEQDNKTIKLQIVRFCWSWCWLTIITLTLLQLLLVWLWCEDNLYHKCFN